MEHPPVRHDAGSASAGSSVVRHDDNAALRRTLSRFQAPDQARSLTQIATSFPPFLLLCGIMYATHGLSTWLTLALCVPTAGFVVRIFILQHDCGHGSLFRSEAANAWVGRACSLVTLTPYRNWRRQHAGHHGVWNNLDRRESGADLYSTCLTREEYRRLGRWRRLAYRFVRHPVVALLILPPLVFLLLYRLPFDTPAAWRRERLSVHATNAALLALFGALGLVLGFGAVALVHLPTMVVASIVGVWLFSVQHRFEGAAWFRGPAWNPTTASLRGTSYLRLPRLLQWFTGNIGFHHVHHLDPRIPNYRLEACHADSEVLRRVPALTLSAALRSARLWLWDEAAGRMVRF